MFDDVFGSRGEIGRRACFRSMWGNSRAGSTPVASNKQSESVADDRETPGF